VIDLFDEMHALTLKFTIKCFVGHEIADNEEKYARFLKLFRAGDPETSTKDFWIIVASFLPGFTKKRAKVYAEMKEMLTEVINERLAKDERGNELLDGFIENCRDQKGNVDYYEVFFLVWTCLTAGTLTTFATASWLLIDLVNNPDAKRDALQEFSEKLSKYGYTGEAVYAMNFFGQCVKETTRCHNHGMAFRLTTTDVDLPHETDPTRMQRIPRDSLIIFPQSSVHWNEDYHKDSQLYNPHRFDTDPLPGTYVGFGGGRHPCPGMRFALQFLRMLAGTLLLEYDFKVDGEVESFSRQVFGLGKPKKPVMVSYSKRNK